MHCCRAAVWQCSGVFAGARSGRGRDTLSSKTEGRGVGGRVRSAALLLCAKFASQPAHQGHKPRETSETGLPKTVPLNVSHWPALQYLTTGRLELSPAGPQGNTLLHCEEDEQQAQGWFALPSQTPRDLLQSRRQRQQQGSWQPNGINAINATVITNGSIFATGSNSGSLTRDPASCWRTNNCNQISAAFLQRLNVKTSTLQLRKGTCRLRTPQPVGRRCR